MNMKNIHFGLITLLVLVVAVVFFAPSTDLEPTALRASQAARALQFALISAALTLSLLLCSTCFGFLHRHSESPLASDDDLVTMNCSRLC
jgi:hypothetical protein